MYQTFDTLKHRWSWVKDFINYTQPKDFWIDVKHTQAQTAVGAAFPRTC